MKSPLGSWKQPQKSRTYSCTETVGLTNPPLPYKKAPGKTCRYSSTGTFLLRFRQTKSNLSGFQSRLQRYVQCFLNNPNRYFIHRKISVFCNIVFTEVIFKLLKNYFAKNVQYFVEIVLIGAMEFYISQWMVYYWYRRRSIYHFIGTGALHTNQRVRRVRLLRHCESNRVGGCPLFGQPSSRTTVRAVRLRTSQVSAHENPPHPIFFNPPIVELQCCWSSAYRCAKSRNMRVVVSVYSAWRRFFISLARMLCTAWIDHSWVAMLLE